jgi:ABC-2 type transport system permease protein
MFVKRAWAVVLRQLFLMRGSLSRVLPLFTWVAVDIVLWGFITKYLNTVTSSGMNFVPTLLGAVLLWDFYIRVMQGVTMTFFEDVWSRNFLNLFTTPISIPEYLCGLVASSIASSLIGLVVMIVLAMAMFQLSFLMYGVMLTPFLFTLFLFGIALGIFASGVVLRFGPATEWFIWPIPALISPFAGVFYPVSTLPAWMQTIARALPPSYVFEGMRSYLAGHGVSKTALLTGAGLDVLYLLLACWFFNRMYIHAVRTGLIARYSAETVS